MMSNKINVAELPDAGDTIKDMVEDRIYSTDKLKNAESLNKHIQELKEDMLIRAKDISDGYHTYGELYDHRMALTVALCHSIAILFDTGVDRGNHCYKSWKHHDGTMFDGMFIVVIETPHGQISYHYNAEHWDKFKIPQRRKAIEWDGHSADDSIDRLLKL